MTKQEARLYVMGAISMALKDPTLQKGFEIICKENAELKEILKNIVNTRLGHELTWEKKRTYLEAIGKAEQFLKESEVEK